MDLISNQCVVHMVWTLCGLFTVVTAITCPPMQRCHWQAISKLAWSASMMRKVEAVSSRSYFRMRSLIDLGKPDDW